MPQALMHELAEVTGGEAICATDVGQHQMWAAQYYPAKHGRSWLTSGGLGTMGYGLPAAMGAAFGNPDRTVMLITGDGSFQMTLQELATCVAENLNVKIIVMNNGCLGMVRQWQELFYSRRYSEVGMRYFPDFVKIAEAYGARGLRATKPEELRVGARRRLRDPGRRLDGHHRLRRRKRLSHDPGGRGALRNRDAARGRQGAPRTARSRMKERHVLSVLVENRFGELARVVGLFAGRGFNIDSLAVNVTTDPGLSRASCSRPAATKPSSSRS